MKISILIQYFHLSSIMGDKMTIAPGKRRLAICFYFDPELLQNHNPKKKLFY